MALKMTGGVIQNGIQEKGHVSHQFCESRWFMGVSAHPLYGDGFYQRRPPLSSPSVCPSLLPSSPLGYHSTHSSVLCSLSDGNICPAHNFSLFFLNQWSPSGSSYSLPRCLYSPPSCSSSWSPSSSQGADKHTSSVGVQVQAVPEPPSDYSRIPLSHLPPVPQSPSASSSSIVEDQLLQQEMVRALKERRTEDAWRSMQSLRRLGVLPSRECLSRLVAQLSHRGLPSSLSRAQRVLSDLRKQAKTELLDCDSLGLLAMSSARTGAARYALSIVRLMLQRDDFPSVKVWSAVVSRLGRHSDDCLLALEFFDEMCDLVRATEARGISLSTMRPDTGAFNAALNACATLGLAEKAEKLCTQLPDFGLSPDTLTFNVLIKVYARTEQRDRLKGIIVQMEEAGVEPDQATLNSLVAAYVGLGDLREAEKLVASLQERPLDEGKEDAKNQNSGGKISMGSSENLQVKGEQGKALSDLNLDSKVASDLGSDSSSNSNSEGLAGLGEAKSQQKASGEAALGGTPRKGVNGRRGWKLKPDARTYTTLMKGYVQKGRTGDAMELLSAMQKEMDPRSLPNEVTYTTAIAACVRLGLMDEARSILLEMAVQKVPANVITYNVLLKGYCSSHQLEKAYALVSDMREAGLSLDVVSYNTLINGCIEIDDNGGALALFREMRERMIPPSEVSYTTLMKAFGRNGQPHLVHQVFEEMQLDPRMRADAVAWNSLIDSYCRSGRMADAKRMFQRMKEARLQPTVATYAMLVKGFARAGMAGEALVLWKEIKERTEATVGSGVEPLQPDEGLLDCLVDTCVRASYFQRALEVVACMEEKGIPADKTKYKRMFIELYSDLYTSRHASQRRRDKSEERRDAVEAFKFWVGLPNKYYQSEWSP